MPVEKEREEALKKEINRLTEELQAIYNLKGSVFWGFFVGDTVVWSRFPGSPTTYGVVQRFIPSRGRAGKGAFDVLATPVILSSKNNSLSKNLPVRIPYYVRPTAIIRST